MTLQNAEVMDWRYRFKEVVESHGVLTLLDGQIKTKVEGGCLVVVYGRHTIVIDGYDFSTVFESEVPGGPDLRNSTPKIT